MTQLLRECAANLACGAEALMPAPRVEPEISDFLKSAPDAIVVADGNGRIVLQIPDQHRSSSPNLAPPFSADRRRHFEPPSTIPPTLPISPLSGPF